jgi:hypothetical protein
MEKKEFSLAKRPASIYGRFSCREPEREGSSIPVQLRLLREYAWRSGLTIEREFRRLDLYRFQKNEDFI